MAAQDSNNYAALLVEMPELASIFTMHVCPYLTLSELQAASAACKAWHQVIQSSEEAWGASARRTLPAGHPVFQVTLCDYAT